MRINTGSTQPKWFAILACGFVAFSASTDAQDNETALIGHWRKTSFNYGATSDEHLIFHPDGSVDTWVVTLSGANDGNITRSAPTTGRWSVAGKNLNIDWGQKQSSRPFFFHEGKLVLPNTPNARQFWDRIGSSQSASAAVAPVPRRNFNAPNPPTAPALQDAAPTEVRSKSAEPGSDFAKAWQEYQRSMPEDTLQAAQKSADAGSAEAQFEMGFFNELGFKSLRPDLRKAGEWYRKAANQGHVLAKEGLEDLSRSDATLSEFDTLKLDIRRMARFQRISSNELDRLHESAMEAIKSIRPD